MEVWVEETARRRSMVVRVQDGMMAMDVEKLAARAVKAVEGHLIGVNGGPAGIQEGSRCADGGGGSKRRIRRDMVYLQGERKEYRPLKAPPGPLSHRPEPLNMGLMA